MSFAAPGFLWLLLGIPLVVLLHFLRTERRRQDVAALFLWHEARNLAEARRRMSPTWLLLIQILFVAAAALALAQPTVSRAGPPDAVLVVDASASMAAVDDGGTSRLDRAREEALALAGSSGRVAVVRAGLDAVVVHALDGERAALRASLADLVPADRTADLERAVELAADIAPGGEIHVFTDAHVAPRANVRVHPVGNPAANFGIVAFDVGLQEAFVAVASNLDRPQEVELVLSRDGEQVASTSLFVPVGGQGTITIPLAESGIYEARLVPPPGDALDLDDVAYAGRDELVVVLDRPNEPLQRALTSLPAVSVRTTGAARTVDADVRVLTGVGPDELDEGRYILLGAPVADPVYRTVRDVDRAHPLMRFVDLRDAVVGLSPEWNPQNGSRDSTAENGAAQEDAVPDSAGQDSAVQASTVQERGSQRGTSDWSVLARDSELTPLVRYRRDPGLQILQLGFHPSQTDIVLRPAFPALIANAIRSFRGEDRLAIGSVLPANATLGGIPVQRALEPGVYLVDGRERPVSLLSAAETRLTAAPAVPADTPEAVRDASGATSERVRSYAPWLLLAAILMLAAEWLLSRRTGWWALRRR